MLCATIWGSIGEQLPLHTPEATVVRGDDAELVWVIVTAPFRCRRSQDPLGLVREPRVARGMTRPGQTFLAV